MNETSNIVDTNKIITTSITSPSEKFAKGMCYFKMFWLFIFGCIIGTYYEQILTLVVTGNWESRRGVLYGPFNPVYGFGMLLFILFLYKVKDWKLILILGALIGGGLEYLLSYLQELFINSRSWDYSNHFLNIQGRTTIPFMLFWGILAVIIVKGVYPFLSYYIELIPKKLGKLVSIIFSIFMFFNMSLTGVVLLRQGQRLQGKEPLSIIGQIIDEIYPDEVLDRIFPNMTKNNSH